MTGQQADLSAPRTVRIAVIVAVAALHLAAIVALIRAFAPGFAEQAAAGVVSTFSVTVRTVEPEPSPSPAPSPGAARAAGAAGEAGRRATPREVTAPRPRIAVRPQAPAPLASSSGSADWSGARDAGAGTGAGASGEGTGNGGAGTGQGGGGGGTKAVKIAGEINSARDYPIASRAQRIGDHVIVWVTVGADGKPAACRVARPSTDAEANAITCRLAMERFRFRPATDGSGRPVTSTYGWRQRWYYRD
jgi:protein TonB